MRYSGFLILLALFLPLSANAGRVSEQQALLKAQQFMIGKTFTTANTRRMAPSLLRNDAAFYVFNAQEGGFAVVSGNDLTDPILGYSDTGRLDMDSLPAHIQSWFDSYADQLAYLDAHPSAPVARKTLSGSSVSPLLGATQWDQEEPYYDLCPTDGGRHCMTGCLARITLNRIDATMLMVGHMTAIVPACRISWQKYGLSFAGLLTLAEKAAPTRLP